MPYTREYVHAMRIAFMVICVVAAGAVGVGAYVVTKQHNQIKHDTQLIQEQRYESVFRNCEDQNRRNRHTVTTLNKEIRQLPAAERARAERTKEFTVLLINALAPVANCRQEALLAVTKPPARIPINIPHLH